VNDDLTSRGMRFIQDTHGQMLMDWNELTADDIVIIPAFRHHVGDRGETEGHRHRPAEAQHHLPLRGEGVEPQRPAGQKDYTVVIHGKAAHEETRATFSHTAQGAPP
jgi:4-hydroxy-3-methylbut-2-enyl diphosphate reductase